MRRMTAVAMATATATAAATAWLIYASILKKRETIYHFFHWNRALPCSVYNVHMLLCYGVFVCLPFLLNIDYAASCGICTHTHTHINKWMYTRHMASESFIHRNQMSVGVRPFMANDQKTKNRIIKKTNSRKAKWNWSNFIHMERDTNCAIVRM